MSGAAFPIRAPRDDRTEEERLFTRDAFDHENEGRFEIDAFRFRRYLVLGWIRAIESFPYYQLTTNGEEIYSRFYGEVANGSDWEYA